MSRKNARVGRRITDLALNNRKHRTSESYTPLRKTFNTVIIIHENHIDLQSRIYGHYSFLSISIIVYVYILGYITCK